MPTELSILNKKFKVYLSKALAKVASSISTSPAMLDQPLNPEQCKLWFCGIQEFNFDNHDHDHPSKRLGHQGKKIVQCFIENKEKNTLRGTLQNIFPLLIKVYSKSSEEISSESGENIFGGELAKLIASFSHPEHFIRLAKDINRTMFHPVPVAADRVLAEAKRRGFEGRALVQDPTSKPWSLSRLFGCCVAQNLDRHTPGSFHRVGASEANSDKKNFMALLKECPLYLGPFFSQEDGCPNGALLQKVGKENILPILSMLISEREQKRIRAKLESKVVYVKSLIDIIQIIQEKKHPLLKNTVSYLKKIIHEDIFIIQRDVFCEFQREWYENTGWIELVRQPVIDKNISETHSIQDLLFLLLDLMYRFILVSFDNFVVFHENVFNNMLIDYDNSVEEGEPNPQTPLYHWINRRNYLNRFIQSGNLVRSTKSERCGSVLLGLHPESLKHMAQFNLLYLKTSLKILMSAKKHESSLTVHENFTKKFKALFQAIQKAEPKSLELHIGKFTIPFPVSFRQKGKYIHFMPTVWVLFMVAQCFMERFGLRLSSETFRCILGCIFGNNLMISNIKNLSLEPRQKKIKF